MAEPILHLAALSDWEQRSDAFYEPAGLAVEGFIHLCTSTQLPGVVERYYQGRADLMLLTVNPDGLGSALVWEDSTGSGEDFPHVYGPLELSAVIKAEPFDASGPAR